MIIRSAFPRMSKRVYITTVITHMSLLRQRGQLSRSRLYSVDECAPIRREVTIVFCFSDKHEPKSKSSGFGVHELRDEGRIWRFYSRGAVEDHGLVVCRLVRADLNCGDTKLRIRLIKVRSGRKQGSRAYSKSPKLDSAVTIKSENV